MRRRLFTFLSALSLLLCVATCVLWVRSRGMAEGITQMVGGHRYTLRSADGCVKLIGPPPEAATLGVRQALASTVAGIRNSDVDWLVMMSNERHGVYIDELMPPRPRRSSASEQVERQYRPDDVVRPLLAALGDPSRFAAAHMLLCRRSAEWRRQWDSELISPPPDDTLDNRAATYLEFLRSRGQAVWARVDHAGLTVDVRLPKDQEAPQFSGSVGQHFVGDPNLTMMSAVREAWCDRLSVPVLVVPYRQVLTGTLALPAVWAISSSWGALRRRRRSRTSLCPSCGYDLRASPERCPECGAVPLKVAKGMMEGKAGGRP